MLIEAAIGDAYGAGFEFENTHIIAQQNTLTYYKAHPLYTEIKGRYTDDTQMSLAISELLVAKTVWTPENIAQKFVEVYKRDKRRGYSKGFLELLDSIDTGADLCKKIRAASERNGAAMRSFSLGIINDTQELLEKTKIQAQITHNTPIAIGSAQAVALVSHYFLYDLGEKKDLSAYLEAHIEGNWTEKWQNEVSMYAKDAVLAALTVLKDHNTLSEILKSAVNFGGDVDTVATIALACAACSKEIKNDLPNWTYTDLENGTYGLDYISLLDKQILALKKN